MSAPPLTPMRGLLLKESCLGHAPGMSPATGGETKIQIVIFITSHRAWQSTYLQKRIAPEYGRISMNSLIETEQPFDFL